MASGSFKKRVVIDPQKYTVDTATGIIVPIPLDSTALRHTYSPRAKYPIRDYWTTTQDYKIASQDPSDKFAQPKGPGHIPSERYNIVNPTPEFIEWYKARQLITEQRLREKREAEMAVMAASVAAALSDGSKSVSSDDADADADSGKKKKRSRRRKNMRKPKQSRRRKRTKQF
jgi:hypothetical protein